jgi:predicted transcriptional regulator
MAKKKDLPDLSRAELDLMRILWRAERLSAREVHEGLDPAYGWAYSTTRTVLERLVAKGYLTRELFHGVNLYRPLISRPQGLARLVRDFADRVLEADRGGLVALFARDSSLSPAEVKELERLLEGEQP